MTKLNKPLIGAASVLLITSTAVAVAANSTSQSPTTSSSAQYVPPAAPRLAVFGRPAFAGDALPKDALTEALLADSGLTAAPTRRLGTVRGRTVWVSSNDVNFCFVVLDATMRTAADGTLPISVGCDSNDKLRRVGAMFISLGRATTSNARTLGIASDGVERLQLGSRSFPAQNNILIADDLTSRDIAEAPSSQSRGLLPRGGSDFPVGTLDGVDGPRDVVVPIAP